MIFEFLLPIIGWLFVILVCYVVYTRLFITQPVSTVPVPGQGLYTALTAFFWITVYITLSTVWSILYSLIDIKYPDAIGAINNGGYPYQGIIFDALAFPLALAIVSSISALFLGFWLIKKFKENAALRPVLLYSFMRNLVFIGGAILAFSGFVYIVYSWLYGNLPIAVGLKAIVAAIIVGMVALYFYLVDLGRVNNKENISRFFALLLVVLTITTLYFSFKIIGTPAQARMYRLDAITLQNLQNVKNEIDTQAQSYGVKIMSLDDITSDYVLESISTTPMTLSATDTDYTLCANFNTNKPATLNITPVKKDTWDYKSGNSCFNFKYPQIPANLIPAPYTNSVKIVR